MNEQNLKKGNPETQFRSGREAVENGRKGGVASGVSRSFKGALKKKIKSSPELIDEVIDTLWELALDGDFKAIKLLLEYDPTNDDLDRKLKRAQLDKLKAETEMLKTKSENADGNSDGENNLLEILKGGGANEMGSSE